LSCFASTADLLETYVPGLFPRNIRSSLSSTNCVYVRVEMLGEGRRFAARPPRFFDNAVAAGDAY
jgi:hypothetical protein